MQQPESGCWSSNYSCMSCDRLSTILPPCPQNIFTCEFALFRLSILPFWKPRQITGNVVQSIYLLTIFCRTKQHDQARANWKVEEGGNCRRMWWVPHGWGQILFFCRTNTKTLHLKFINTNPLYYNYTNTCYQIIIWEFYWHFKYTWLW